MTKNTVREIKIEAKVKYSDVSDHSICNNYIISGKYRC